MSFFKNFVHYHPMEAGGGGGNGPGGDLTDPGAPSGDAGSGEGQDGGVGDGGGEDDYSDLADDERVQAYLKKQYGHIPEEHRSPDGFKQLLGARDQVGSLQQQLQALHQRGQQQGNGQQQQQRAAEKAFHEDILAGLEKDLGTPLPPNQRRFFGGMIDAIHKAMDGHVQKSYFTPMRDAFINQRLTAERERAEALPGYKENVNEINKVVSSMGIPFDVAYKIVMYDKGQKKAPAGGSIVAGAGNGSAASGTSGNGSKRPVSDGDRPSGASAPGGKMPKYKTPEDASRGAEAALRRAGVNIRR